MAQITDAKEKFDLVITPQLYIMKRSDLPIKYSFQAKKIAPSILEEFALGKELAYEVIKEEETNEWIFIGYNPEKIEKLLLKKGLKPEQIGNIYFAQQFQDQLEKAPLILSDKEALSVINKIVTLVPANLIDEKAPKITPFMLKKPQKSFRFKFKKLSGASSSLIDTKLAILASVAMGLFGVGWWLDGIKASSAFEKLEESLSEQISSYPSLQSSITRKNIYTKYSKIDKKQRAIREFLKGLGKLVTRDSKVVSLKIDNKEAQAILNVKPNYLNRIQRIAKKLGYGVDKKSSTTLVVKKAIL
jgi:hypothetical protein